MMITRLRHWWGEVQSSFWFVPAAMVLGAVCLALCLIGVDSAVELHGRERWPLAFGAGAAGARGLLSTVAGSMITVAGVVFSITIVALSLTSSQYTSRILRTVMGDRANQVVLGVFVSIFAYCLVVLRTIRGGDEGAFVPSLAVLAGLLLAFVGLGHLIFFIHHISVSIQASSIVAAVAKETIAAVDQLFPDELGEDADEEEDGAPSAADGERWTPLGARETGYLQSLDAEGVLAWARRHRTTLRMERGIGEFVVEGAPLVSVAPPCAPDEEAAAELHRLYFINRQRTVEQDAGFGVRQLVDIAMKALSPGVNDATTAVMCVDYLGAILARIAARGIATRRRMDEGELRVIARGPSFDGLLAEAFDQIRQSAAGNPAILARQLDAIEVIAGQTTSARRRQALRRQADSIIEVAERTIQPASDGAAVRAAWTRARRALDPRPTAPPPR